MHDVFMSMARTLALRSTCRRRVQVGAIVTSMNGTEVLGIGYNGPARGLPHDCAPRALDRPAERTACVCGHLEEVHIDDIAIADTVTARKRCTSCKCMSFRPTAAVAPGTCTCIHAEVNALIKAPYAGQQLRMYTTLEPCIACARLILNSAVVHLYYADEYRDHSGIELLADAGILVERLT